MPNPIDHQWSRRASDRAQVTAIAARAVLIDVEAGGFLWMDAIEYIDRAIKELSEAKELHLHRVAAESQKDRAA